jgi:uncharacterized protein (DUF58 family)
MTKLPQDSPTCFDPRTLAKLAGLELRARSIVEGYVAGMHRSPFHGFSVEFAEHREYVPGDDVRHVDWKVFGKTDKYYLKQYEEETNLICYLALDASESMTFQSADAAMSKLDYARTAAAALAYLVLRQQDSVGLAVFDQELRTVVRPSGNPSHLKQLTHVMEHAETGRKTATGQTLHDLAERWTKRGVVILLSDLFDNLATLTAGLKHLRHRRHEVIVFQVLDPAELDFPFDQTTLFRGLEAWPDTLTDPKALRKAYLAEFEKFLHEVRRACREQQADYLQLRTDQPLDLALSGYLSKRLERRG